MRKRGDFLTVSLPHSPPQCSRTPGVVPAGRGPVPRPKYLCTVWRGIPKPFLLFSPRYPFPNIVYFLFFVRLFLPVPLHPLLRRRLPGVGADHCLPGKSFPKKEKDNETERNDRLPYKRESGRNKKKRYEGIATEQKRKGVRIQQTKRAQ